MGNKKKLINKNRNVLITKTLIVNSWGHQMIQMSLNSLVAVVTLIHRALFSLSAVIHQIFELPQGSLSISILLIAGGYRCISCEYWQLTWFPEFPAQTTDSRQPTVRLYINLSVRLSLSLCCRQTAAHISGNSPGRKCKSTAAKVFFGWNPRGMQRTRVNNDFKIHFQKGSKQ